MEEVTSWTRKGKIDMAAKKKGTTIKEKPKPSKPKKGTPAGKLKDILDKELRGKGKKKY